jgi:uncharacterized peroxidase-related enzyme
MPQLFLPEVENHSKPEGHYAASIAALKAAKKEVPGIMHLLAFRPKAGDFLNQYTHEVMRGDSPLTPGFRELIATVVSASNECAFCRDSHAEAASILAEKEGRAKKGKGHDFVAGVLEGDAELTDAEWALMEFLVQLNLESQDVEERDLKKLRKMGLSDAAIFDGITVCALFNFYNRWVGGNGVDWETEEASQASGARIAERGYLPKG